MERATHAALARSNQSGEAQRVKSALLHAPPPAAAAGPERDDSEDDASHMDDEDGDSYSNARSKDIRYGNRESLGEHSQRELTEVEDDLPISSPFDDARELRARHDQLQDDVEVLAAHLEAQTLEREKERAAMRLLQNQLQHANMEMARELHSFRIENDALRRQHALLQQDRDAFQQKAAVAAETQEELLLALKKQQRAEEQLQSANVLIVRERAQIRKALEATQNHCRRLEEELATLQTHVMQLQSERTALQAVAAASSSGQHTREAEQIKLQDEMIDSLRTDLLQMEFEYKTLALDRETLNERLTKLQKRLCAGGDAYDVIPLGKAVPANKPLSSKQLKQLEREQAKLEKQRQQQKEKEQQQRKKLNIRPIRNHYESENGGFSGVMELPNFIGDHPRRGSSSSSNCSLAGDACLPAAATPAPPLRRSSSVSALVSKTVSSARKKLFAPSQHKVVLPQ